MVARILIIEDNPTNIELMAYLLTAFGYQVNKALEGQSGIALALKETPDLIICDIEMPGLNGFDVLRSLRDHEKTSKIPTLAVTAYAMVGDREKVLAAGFDGYISKPIDPETFVRDVGAFLPGEKRSSEGPKVHDSGPAWAPAEAAKGPLVLVVDDSPVNLALIRSTLEPNGYRVITAETVALGIKLTRHYAFDLILSDLHMSPSSGLDFLKLVKTDASLRSIPFLLCTSSRTDMTDGLEQQTEALGGALLLNRPISPDRLLEEVAACLKNRREELLEGTRKRGKS